MARAARWDGFIPIQSQRADGVATPEDIAAARDRIAALRGGTEGFDIAVWGTLDTDGTLASRLPGYAAAGVTWWIESVEIDEAGWQEAIAARVQAAGPAG